MAARPRSGGGSGGLRAAGVGGRGVTPHDALLGFLRRPPRASPTGTLRRGGSWVGVGAGRAGGGGGEGGGYKAGSSAGRAAGSPSRRRGDDEDDGGQQRVAAAAGSGLAPLGAGARPAPR